MLELAKLKFFLNFFHSFDLEKKNDCVVEEKKETKRDEFIEFTFKDGVIN